jgi:hypothetical protein
METTRYDLPVLAELMDTLAGERWQPGKAHRHECPVPECPVRGSVKAIRKHVRAEH